MSTGHRHALFVWAGLLGLAAIEFGAAFIPMQHGLRPLLLLPALVMVALVSLVFMRVQRSVAAARGFALAALVWLLLLLGLGTMDPMTRAFHVVTVPYSAIPQ